MERSDIRDLPVPHFAALNAGYEGAGQMVDQALPGVTTRPVGRGGTGLRRALRRKSTIAFLMTLPLILLILLLVLYPALYAIDLATLNKSMQRHVGFDNFTWLFKRETFWMVVRQSCVFAITAVI